MPHSVNTIQFWSTNTPFQAPGTMTWQWAHGDKQYYFDFCVRPTQPNTQVSLDKVASISDQANNQTTLLTVTVGPNGTMLQFTGIEVQTF